MLQNKGPKHEGDMKHTFQSLVILHIFRFHASFKHRKRLFGLYETKSKIKSMDR